MSTEEDKRKAEESEEAEKAKVKPGPVKPKEKTDELSKVIAWAKKASGAFNQLARDLHFMKSGFEAGSIKMKHIQEAVKKLSEVIGEPPSK